MKETLRNGSLAVLLLAAAFASPLHAADIEVGVRHVLMHPVNGGAFDGGTLEIGDGRGFAATADVFWTDRVSTQLAATFVNPEVILFPSAPPPSELDLGTIGMTTWSATARYHFAPHARLSWFAGVGPALVQVGDLDDRFGEAIEVRFSNVTTVLGEAGVRYHLGPRLAVDLAMSYMPLEAKASSYRNDDPQVVIPHQVTIDPLTVSVGATWRF